MIICVVGPTGVGKTKLSVMLAKKYEAIIVGCDATQIYKHLNIGSAKVTEEEKEGIPHLLIDIKEPNEEYSVFDYQKDLRNIIAENKDHNIIIVGGTGLYLKSALYNYEFSEMENRDFTKYSNEELYKMCLDINPDLNIHQNNRRRLENFLARKDKKTPKPTLLYEALFIGLTTDREVLYERINQRVEEMIQNGLVEEVSTLYQKYGLTKILSRAIGYKEIIKYLDNEISLDEAIELIKKNSRHYAKRQYTWFNNQMHITWFNTNFNDFNKTYEEVVEYIEKNK